MVGKVIHWEVCEKLKFDSTNNWSMHNQESVLKNETQKTPLGFWDTNWSPNLRQTTRPSDSHKKKRTCWVVDFGVPADNRVKLKENEKRNKYLDFAREFKKLWNMKVTVIPIVIGALATVTKALIQGLGGLEISGRVKRIETTALLRLARILRRVPECSKLVQKEYKTRHDLVGKVIPWEMCKKFKCDHANKWYMYNPSAVLENDTHKFLWDFDIQTDHLITVGRPNLIIINKKKKICKIVDFAVPADHRIKLKEYVKRDKYLDLARELKKLWKMKVTIIPIVIGAFGTVTKWLLKSLDDLEVGGWVETIQTTALLKTAWILREVQETWGDLLSLNLQWKTIT